MAKGDDAMTSGIQIVANRNISKVTITDVEDRPGRAAEIFGTLGAQGFNVELVVSTGGREGRADISLAIARSQEAQVNDVMEKIRATNEVPMPQGQLALKTALRASLEIVP